MNPRHGVAALGLLTVVTFAFALLLLHGSGHQTVRGYKTDPADPDAPGERTSAKVECAPAASGPRLDDEGETTDTGDLAKADGVAEDDGFTLGQEGLDVAEVSAVCDRVRTERVVHAGELGFLGLVLVGWLVRVLPSARRVPAPRWQTQLGRPMR